jgi:arylsulfatase A-like enzyme
MGCSERIVAALIGALLLAALGPGCSRDPAPEPAAPAPVAPTPGGPRDLLLVTVDTLRADRLGCYGNARGLTPNLDRLAAEGTRFAHARTPMPCTAAAHAALFTGLSPRSSGVTSNFVQARDELVTLAERLKERGFATIALFNMFDFSGLNLVQGFDAVGFDKTRRAERIVPGYARWLGETRGAPRRFAWLHFFIPHGPLDFPPEFARFVEHRYDGPIQDDFRTLEKARAGELALPEEFVRSYRDRYDAAVAFADARVGELRSALEQAGALDSTLLVVLADHGESLERGVVGLHSPVIREATLHVPLLMRGPGAPARRVVDAVVQTMDLAPTIEAALGLPIRSEQEGRDLSPLLRAEDPSSVDWQGRAIATLPAQFEGKSAADAEAAAVRVGSMKLVLKEKGARELYDVVADPQEERDLAGARPDVVRALDAAFAEWTRSTAVAAGGGMVDQGMQELLRKLGY